MHTVADYFNSKYRDYLKHFLAGIGGMWSTWGVQHLEDSVITKKPNAEIIEFGINDACQKHQTSPVLAQFNLEYIIERIKLAYPSCEIILQVMNIPVNKSAGFRPNLNPYYEMYRKVAKRRKLLLIDITIPISKMFWNRRKKNFLDMCLMGFSIMKKAVRK